jgi:hypothetical protein
MATNNRFQGSENRSFKPIEGEGDGWLSTYVPAISAGTVMAVILFLAISCSKKSDNPAKIAAPVPPAVMNPAPSTRAAVSPEPPKKIRKQRPTNATYVNGAYGVSFTYPRKYSLQAGVGKSLMPVPANFVKPGAIEIASVDMPDSSYSETDFLAGLLYVTVNLGITSDECSQFATNSDLKSGEVTKPETVKIGANEFTVLEQMSGEMEHQSDLKYFHVFKNGACYEFAMDVETSRKPDEDLAQVDRGEVFQQLSRILTSARIKDVELPGVENADKTPAASAGSASQTATTTPITTTAAPDSQAQKAQMTTPEQK